MAVYTKEKLAKSKTAALELLIKVSRGRCHMLHFSQNNIISAINLNVTSTEMPPAGSANNKNFKCGLRT